MQVLFDGDVVVYRAGFAAEKTHYFVYDPEGSVHDFTKKAEATAFCDRNPTYTLAGSEKIVEPVENAIYNAKSIITSALEPLGANESELVVVLSGATNFRNGVATYKPYKGNRDADHRPVHGPDIVAYIKRRFNVVETVDEEADDVLGYMQYDVWKADPFSSVICSIDKDLDMIPGLHYNFRDQVKYHVDVEQADRYFWIQMLKGDTVDNIPGVPGCGPKNAEATLKDLPPEGWYIAVRTKYQEAYGDKWYDAMTEMGRLLWIRREPNEWWTLPKDEVP